MLLLLACTAANDTGAGDTTAPPDSGDTDTHETGAPAPGHCPEGMAPVPSDDPAYCVDVYEASVVDGVAVSREGLLPTQDLGYDGSVAACEATPVLDDAGEPVGWKRLVTSEEWEDAADGVVGEGGKIWPYGDEFDATACATPLADGTVVLDAEQPSGSFPRCVSDFGVVDLAGNVWEFADSGFVIDNAGWVEARTAEGTTVSLDEDGVRILSGDASGYRIQIHGVGTSYLSVAEDGRLYVESSVVTPMDSRSPGYVTPTPLPTASSDFLLVTLVEDVASERHYPVAFDEDGAPVPDKRGGAWYTGDATMSRNDERQLVHYHTFRGTIGFRCASDPLP